MTGNLITILCIDDEEDILEVVRLSLETMGNYEILTAQSGPEGVAAAAAFKPDLIMLDVMMPATDGLETLKFIQSNEVTSNIPVIFMTARIQPPEIAQYMAKGVAGVIAKPFDPLLLAGQVQEIWERHNAR